ncbi:Hypothetical protein CINCED_3A005042 [Cinara cedri]|uniref:Uncharacterized protein n=1 Tax=Cinara cedri TaxID=506608 RepID=A0A5E4M669_9HEMI|nr:Hypothetical protein CINCED_3A005042 [Cinara cedri]
MALAESLDILEKVQVQLQKAQGNDEQKVYKKFETVLNKNNGLKILKQISKIISRENDNMDSPWIVYLKILPQMIYNTGEIDRKVDPVRGPEFSCVTSYDKNKIGMRKLRSDKGLRSTKDKDKQFLTV